MNDLENYDDLYDTDDNIVFTSKPDFYLGKDNKTKWLKNRHANNTKRQTHNIITQPSGVNLIAKHVVSVIDCWKLFFPDFVVNEIAVYTNKYLDKIHKKYQRQNIIPDTNKDEIDALFGLLYLARFLRSNHLNLKDLWCNNGFAPEYF